MPGVIPCRAGEHEACSVPLGVGRGALKKLLSNRRYFGVVCSVSSVPTLLSRGPPSAANRLFLEPVAQCMPRPYFTGYPVTYGPRSSPLLVRTRMLCVPGRCCMFSATPTQASRPPRPCTYAICSGRCARCSAASTCFGCRWARCCAKSLRRSSRCACVHACVGGVLGRLRASCAVVRSRCRAHCVARSLALLSAPAGSPQHRHASESARAARMHWRGSKLGPSRVGRRRQRRKAVRVLCPRHDAHAAARDLRRRRLRRRLARLREVFEWTRHACCELHGVCSPARCIGVLLPSCTGPSRRMISMRQAQHATYACCATHRVPLEYPSSTA